MNRSIPVRFLPSRMVGDVSCARCTYRCRIIDDQRGLLDDDRCRAGIAAGTIGVNVEDGVGTRHAGREINYDQLPH